MSRYTVPNLPQHIAQVAEASHVNQNVRHGDYSPWPKVSPSTSVPTASTSTSTSDSQQLSSWENEGGLYV
jgi:hypothetical protein